MNISTLLVVVLVLNVGVSAGRAAAPFFKPNDVVAFVGSEDAAAAAEFGQLELRLTRAWPDYRIKFRSLAWEGDTVFQQVRDLNYPALEQQLDDAGATVVIAQFGQIESMAGDARVSDFVAAYETLIAQLSGGGKRKVVLQAPTPVPADSPAAARFKSLPAYTAAIREIAQRKELLVVMPADAAKLTLEGYRDGLHLNEAGHAAIAAQTARLLGVDHGAGQLLRKDESTLAGMIQIKNRLWFHYVRPQNWAFLNGDRTVQPSSRDHVDPEKRWFPEEMKGWLPRIAMQEDEIWKFARGLGTK